MPLKQKEPALETPTNIDTEGFGCKMAETGVEIHQNICAHIRENFGKTAALPRDQDQEMILGVSNCHCH